MNSKPLTEEKETPGGNPAKSKIHEKSEKEQINTIKPQKSKIIERGNIQLEIDNMTKEEITFCNLYVQDSLPQVTSYLIAFMKKSKEEVKELSYTDKEYINATNYANNLIKKRYIKLFIQGIKEENKSLCSITKKEMLDKYAKMFKNNALDSIKVTEGLELYTKEIGKDGQVEYKSYGNSSYIDLSAFENPSEVLKNSVQAIYKTKSGIKITFYNIKEIGIEIARLGGFYEPDKVDIMDKTDDKRVNSNVKRLLQAINQQKKQQEIEPSNRITDAVTN